jgi:pyrroline-5-carboxylate reductase
MIKVGIIGYGNMGQAIGERIKYKYAVCVFDKIKRIVPENITVVNNVIELAEQSEVIILAVKPQDFDSLLNGIKSFIKDKLIISIAAGVSTEHIRSQLKEEIRIIRVMPNLPAWVGQGVSVLFKDKFATEKDLNLASQLLSFIGLALPVDDENIINAATAVSGSGPAFFCQHIKDKVNADRKRNEFIKMLVTAAISINLDQQFSIILAEKTIDGTIAVLKEKNLSCEELIKMVASKGGTTQAGLEALQSGGTLKDAVKSALRRAGELGQRS